MSAIIKEERIGGQRLILGDCLKVMPTLGRFDAVVTDPPYELSDSGPGKSHFGMSLNKFDGAAYKAIVSGVDYKALFDAWDGLMAPLNGFVFCSNKQVSKLMLESESRGLATTLLVWHKTNAAPFANGVWRGDIEYIVHFRGKGATFVGNATEKTKVIQHPIVQDPSHPTVKPAAVIDRLLHNCTKPGQSVLDPFMGSGTTLAACQRAGRAGTGIELDPAHFETACDRVHKAWQEPDMFIAPPDPPKQEDFDL